MPSASPERERCLVFLCQWMLFFFFFPMLLLILWLSKSLTWYKRRETQVLGQISCTQMAVKTEAPWLAHHNHHRHSQDQLIFTYQGFSSSPTATPEISFTVMRAQLYIRIYIYCILSCISGCFEVGGVLDYLVENLNGNRTFHLKIVPLLFLFIYPFHCLDHFFIGLFCSPQTVLTYLCLSCVWH